MDLNSYIQLKEALTQVGQPQQPQQLTESVDSIWEEVEAFAHHLVEEEGLDLSDMTWDEVREAYLGEALKGPDGKPLPVTAKDKEAVAKAKNDAAYAAKAKEFKRKNPGVTDMTAFSAGGGTEKAKQQGVDTGSGGSSAFRRSVQNSNIERQGRNNIANKDRNVANQAKAKADAAAKNEKDKKSFMDLMVSKIPKNKKDDSSSNNGGGNGGGGNGGGGGGGRGGSGGGGNNRPSAKPTGANDPRNKAYVAARDKANSKDATAADKAAAKKTGMDAWAKANSGLAKDKAQRDATRGTSASTNPLMKDLKNRMPKPAAPNPAVRPARTAPKTGAAAKATLKNFASAGSTATPKPVASKPPGSTFNPNAPKVMVNNSVEYNDFDSVLESLMDSGFGLDEALALMVNMSEEKDWIQGAIKKPGALHREMGIPEGEKIPEAKLKAAAKKGGKLGERARLAMTLKGFHKEANFEEWVDFLLAEGEDLSDFSVNELNDLLTEMSKSEKEDKEGHAIALYKDQWKDRKIADYDETHGRKGRAKEMRADAGEDRKRMKNIYGKDWKHSKYSTGENKDSKEPMEKGMKNEEYGKKGKEGHAIALFKDQETDRREADYDKEKGKDKRSSELRADAGEDRKRMKKMYGKEWDHNKYSTGEKEDSKEPMEKGMKRQKTHKEEMDSLYQAYLSMMSEEGCDARKDEGQERKGTDARTDYSKPPAAGNDFGKKKPMSDEDRSAAMAKVVAKLKKKGGK